MLGNQLVIHFVINLIISKGHIYSWHYNIKLLVVLKLYKCIDNIMFIYYIKF